MPKDKKIYIYKTKEKLNIEIISHDCCQSWKKLRTKLIKRKKKLSGSKNKKKIQKIK